MKKYTLIILFVSLFISCKNNKVRKYPNGNIKEEIPLNNKNLKDGEGVGYYEDGSIKWRISYVNDTLHGKGLQYYPNGQIQFLTEFVKGKKDGDYFEYFENGILKQRSHYKNGFEDGNFLFYYHNGKIKMNAFLKNDTSFYYQEFDSLGNLINDKHKIIFSILSNLNSTDSIKIKAEIRGMKNDKVSTVIFDPNSNAKQVGDFMNKINDSIYVYTFPPKAPSKYVIMVNFLKDQQYRNDFDTLITIK